MKIYVILTESVVDGEFETSVYLFSTFEKAKIEFDKMVAETKQNDHLMECDDVVVEESETEFTIYEDGYYSIDHYSVWIEEKNVDKN